MTPNPAYAIRSLKFVYDRDTALDIPDLDIPKGEICIFTGPNGSGKSTLLSILALLQVPSSGDVFLDGSPCTGDPPPELRRKVTLVHQNPMLFSTSVRRNLAFGLRTRAMSAKEIDTRIRSMAEDMHLSALLDKRARALSGGEMQRVVLARALILQTPVVLLDEPTNSLDDAYRPMLAQLLQKIHRDRGTTFVIATHDSNFVSSLPAKIYRTEKGFIRNPGM
jgi:tungstate transport system ATP-binding protein